MTLWKPSRDPSLYPARWHFILQAPAGQYILETASEKELDLVTKKFHAFKASLKAHPYHETSKSLKLYRIRLSRARVSAGSGAQGALLVTKEPRPEAFAIITAVLAGVDLPQDMRRKD